MKQREYSWLQTPNFYLIPGYNPIRLSKKLEAQFHGSGGLIEQSGLYINPSGAAAWMAIASQAEYLDIRANAPFQDIAKYIVDYHLQNVQSLDVWALGPGDGRNETQFAQHLLFCLGDIRFILLDVSFALLEHAYHHAVSTLGSANAHRIYGVCGDMHDINQRPYSQLYTQEGTKKTRRIVALIGRTLGSIENELLFIKNSLSGFAKDDLLLLDVCKTFAPAEDEQLVQAHDPRLAHTYSPEFDAAYAEFFADSIYHYCRNLEMLHFFQERDFGCDYIPGSYTVAMRAKIKRKNQAQKSFTLMQYKRYDTPKLVLELEKYGWHGLAGWDYGVNCVMYLFKKT